MTTGRTLLLVSAAAMVRGDGRLLLARRPEGKSMAGLWEFPGGKIEPGESPEEALVRELHEELAVTARIPDLQPFAFASHAYERFHLLMPVFLCRRWEGEPVPREGQDVAWASAAELRAYPVPPADAPLVEYFISRSELGW